ncbi:MAG: hypothetical protein LBE37_06615 [Sphingobacterium sp.]|nr:hypothetical protein [Sphingobacterium sp.]
MRALKNNWLRAGITLLFLLGAFFVVKAMSDNKKEPKIVKKMETVIFRYQAPTGVSDPYDEAHIENTENWVQLTPDCSSSSTPNAPCSIEVELGNTIGGLGDEIDPLKVTIKPKFVSTARYMVDTPSLGDNYANPVNTQIP